jgi:hypothetical protein
MAQTRLSQIGQINDVIGCPCLGLVLALAAPAGAVERQASPHNRPLPGREVLYCPAQQARQAQNSAQPNQAPHASDESSAEQRRAAHPGRVALAFWCVDPRVQGCWQWALVSHQCFE